jgi:hypothetical protein
MYVKIVVKMFSTVVRNNFKITECALSVIHWNTSLVLVDSPTAAFIFSVNITIALF